MQNEVTKVKEKLEFFLSEINNEIKLNEKINIGIKKIKNEDKKNNMIALTYISNINRNQKKINKLISEPKKSLKFSYKEEKSNIEYHEFFLNDLNRLSMPKDIQFKDIFLRNLTLSWSFEKNQNTNSNVNVDKIKYKVEMRKKNEQFNNVYEGNNPNCIINNLDYDTEYEFRICAFYDEAYGPWTDIIKVKTIDLISAILKDEKRRNEYINKMLKWSGYNNMELLYRGSRDGMTSKIFHDRCDNKGPTITLLRNDKSIFGGFNDNSWTSNSKYINSSNCFLFTLVNVHNIEPTIFPFKNNKEYQYSTYNNSINGPCFGRGYDIGIYQSDFLNNNSNCNFPYSFIDTTGKGKSIFTGDLNNDKEYFRVKEIEIFKLLK